MFNTSRELFFFSFWFSGYCRFVSSHVVSIVSGGCNQSSSTLFMKSWRRCKDVSPLFLMLASPLSPFLDTYNLPTLSLGCNALCIVISFLVLWSICLSSLIHFKNSPEYLMMGDSPGIYSFDKVSAIKFLSRVAVLNFFFHLLLIDSVNTQYPQVFVGFLFSGRSSFVFIR